MTHKRLPRPALKSDLERVKAVIVVHTRLFRTPHVRHGGSDWSPVKGPMAIGVGRDLSFGISDEEADYLLTNDIRRIIGQLDPATPWWRKLAPARQAAMISLAHHSGTPYLLRLKRMLVAMERGLYEKASAHALKAARYRYSDVAETAAHMIYYGCWPKWAAQ